MDDAEVMQAIRAAMRVVMDPALRLLQDDPHSWSERPCATCQAISSIVGKRFGCYEYAHQRRAARVTAGPREGA